MGKEFEKKWSNSLSADAAFVVRRAVSRFNSFMYVIFITYEREREYYDGLECFNYM